MAGSGVIAGASSAAQRGLESVSSESVQFDFRDNAMPVGVEIVGAEQGGFIIQRDGSSAFKLASGSYLKVDTGLTGLGGKYLNDYTLTMDVLFDSLPSDSATLFQSGGKYSSMPNIFVEVIIYMIQSKVE